jgi:hypothetical protein
MVRYEFSIAVYHDIGGNPSINDIHRMVFQLKLDFSNSGANGIRIRIDCFEQLSESMTLLKQLILELL